jgi:subfamily B ATP-binding cassette protein MsbA
MLARFRPYYRYLQPVRRRFIASILLGILSGGASSAGISSMVKIVFKPVFDSGDGPRMELLPLLVLFSLIPITFGIRCVAQFLNSYLLAYCGTVVLEGLRTDLFAKFQRLPLGFFQKSRSGELLSRAVSDAQQAQLILTSSASDIVVLPATVVGGVGYIVYQAFVTPGAGMFLLGLLVVPVAVLPIKIIGKNLYNRAKQAFAANGEVSEMLRENLSAVREVRAFCLEEREKTRFRDAVRRFFRQQMKVNKYQFALSPMIEFITAFGLAGALLMAYYAHTPWSCVWSMLPAMYFSYDALRKIGKLQAELTRGAAALERLEHVLLEPEPIADPAHPVSPGRIRGDIEFRSVDFTYGGGESELVLKDVSVQIPAGSVVALVGPSGAGKTTFANLVPRFYQATTGAVFVDGIDVRQMTMADLRSAIAVVSQDPFLFNDTIYNNLLLGRPGATRAEVEQAARDAFAHDFILSVLPNGYETMVGERGASLSGGQRQRIALARAFLRNAPILILDEATSALDSESEYYIQRALQKLVIGKTVLMIAHRFSTLRDANIVLVFDRGSIVARGSHAEVYRSNPLYRGLYDQQQIR